VGKERIFFTGSARIIGDPRPSGLDLRVYACVSLHDGMSLVKGKGRGCYANFATLTAQIGCDAANLSRSLKRLVDWGYLTEERQTDRRRKSYRVTFETAESWQSRQQFAANELLQIVGNGVSRNGRNPPQTDSHYSSLKGLNSLEREKLDSPEGARFAARGLSKMDFGASVGAKLAVLEHALSEGEEIDVAKSLEFLGEVWGIAEHRGRAFRLADELAKRVPDAERPARGEAAA